MELPARAGHCLAEGFPWGTSPSSDQGTETCGLLDVVTLTVGNFVVPCNVLLLNGLSVDWRACSIPVLKWYRR